MIDKGCVAAKPLAGGLDLMCEWEGFDITERRVTLITASTLGH